MNHDLNKRRLTLAALATLGAGALANTLPAFAQAQSKPAEKIWRVGFLNSRRRPASFDADFIGGFLLGMRERGYVEGKNLVIEWRFADDNLARLAAFAEELVQLKVDAIVAGGPQVIRAVQQATATIPIVMAVPGDPVRAGFIKSLAYPGGNITGAMVNAGDLFAKRLEMLLEISPGLTRVAFLMNPGNPGHVEGLANLQAGAQKVRVKILPIEAHSPQDIVPAFAAMKREKVGGVITQPDAIFIASLQQVAELALKQRLPLISGIREYVDAGCLMSYGASFRDNYRRAAYFVDRIFKGTKPADLPVEWPTKFELFINGKTAKALGLKIPHSLLITAEKVIE